ncbi:MAG: hypothetical protein WCF88_21415 [Candidatus Acidiferrales bacterium]|jgi:hypothetical protein
MEWIWQNHVWLFDGFGGAIVVGLILWLLNFVFRSAPKPTEASPLTVRADRESNVVGSPIASGSHITQTINIAGQIASPNLPVRDYRPDPTPEAILQRVRSAPPFDQAQIMKNYHGLPIRWSLRLGGISPVEDLPDIRSLSLLPIHELANQIILCRVSISQYPHLKIAQTGDLLDITGTVEEVSMMGYAINLSDVNLVFRGPHARGQAATSPTVRPSMVQPSGDEDSSAEISEISFDHLPASLLDNGWVPADPHAGASGSGSTPPDCSGGLTRVAKSSDAVDFKLEKYQRACNRLRFRAKLADEAHVYAKVQLLPNDGRNVPKTGWIACDIGDKPPQQRPHDEWVIFRRPQKHGWALFDLHLPDEVKRTFGQGEGFEFGELLAIRLRGSLSVSPIKLYLEEAAKPSDRHL